MKREAILKFAFTVGLIIIVTIGTGPFFAAAQQEADKKSGGEVSQKNQDGSTIDLKTIGTIMGLLVAAFAIYGFIHYKKRKEQESIAARKGEEKYQQQKQKEREKSNVDQYREALKKELGRIGVVGPGFETITTPIQETFTSLRISESSREHPGFPGKYRKMADTVEKEMYLSPEEVIVRAFKTYRLLLIIGDPGSGKTTLLKYYAITCLDGKQGNLGFGKKGILPLYFPLRELRFEDDQPLPLHENLAIWAEKNYLDISADEFKVRLKKRDTLVLLDGLDEISEKERRVQVCDWVKRAWTGLDRARFVLTSRPTGFRKSDGVELECDHLRGDIMDFSPQQQEGFLDRFFGAVYRESLPPDADEKEKLQAQRRADDRAGVIREFLDREENKSVRELARVPMLLQVMAIIWKDRDFLPGSRSELYDVSLDYLLAYRDQRKKLYPLLPAEKARIVLCPTARWLQEELKSDNAPVDDIYEYMSPILDTLEGQPGAKEFCENLRDRAGLIADYGEKRFIFRHKSFMEFLAGMQLVKEGTAKPKRVAELVGYFGDPWWEETLRFFFSKSDVVIFDRFMGQFFKSQVSRHLDGNQQTLLQNLVREAPQKRIDSLVKCLNDEDLNADQVRYILDCLKTIGTPESIEAVETFMAEGKAAEANLDYAEDILAEFTRVEVGTREALIEEQLKETPDSFRNTFEDNVEYIKIPGGSYKFSVTKYMESVPDLFFCKTPVTNKRYRRFIAYLGGREKELLDILLFKAFSGKLLEFSRTVKGLDDYLGRKPGKWHDELRSRYDDNKKFNGGDQPVVGVTWYGARCYCFWLSCLDEALKNGGRLPDAETLSEMFRLPTEVEWEWAAAGREPDGTLREYPWAKDRGEPNPDLANWGENVGATTPVGRYPQGATPEGLLDMAGNAWEWMGNSYSENKEPFGLRGGSWHSRASYLCCAVRSYGIPDYYWNGDVGFRVLRPNP